MDLHLYIPCLSGIRKVHSEKHWISTITQMVCLFPFGICSCSFDRIFRFILEETYTRPIPQAVQLFVKTINRAWKGMCIRCLKEHVFWKWPLGRCVWHSIKTFPKLELTIELASPAITAAIDYFLSPEFKLLKASLNALKTFAVAFVVLNLIQTIICLSKTHPPTGKEGR